MLDSRVYVELSAEGSECPWIARVVGRRTGEVQCEWLWHPSEATDFVADPSVYGKRELILRHDEQTKDWNSEESIVRPVVVLPLEEYKKLVADGFLYNGENIAEDAAWYFRQVIDAQPLPALKPPLEPEVYRLNPNFVVGVDEARYHVVPANPERQYYKCSACSRRFEIPADQEESALLDPDFVFTIPWKIDINSPDIADQCFECRAATAPMEKMVTRASKRARVQHESVEGDIFADSDGGGVSNQSGELSRRQQARYGKLIDIFSPAFTQLQKERQVLQFESAEQFANRFLALFEEETERRKMSSKDIHQRFHDIFQNLKRPNNGDLRRRILTGQFPVERVVTADVKDLAPDSLKRKREAEQRRYFEQQVLLAGGPTDGQTVLKKTHKGLEEVAEPKQHQDPLSTRDENFDDAPTLLDNQATVAALPIAAVLRTLAARTVREEAPSALSAWVANAAMKSPWLKMDTCSKVAVPDAVTTMELITSKSMQDEELVAEIMRYTALKRYTV